MIFSIDRMECQTVIFPEFHFPHFPGQEVTSFSDNSPFSNEAATEINVRNATFCCDDQISTVFTLIITNLL